MKLKMKRMEIPDEHNVRRRILSKIFKTLHARDAWLCSLGMHKWREVGRNSMLDPIPVMRCERCGIGRKFHINGAEFRYSKEVMDEEMKRFKGEE